MLPVGTTADPTPAPGTEGGGRTFHVERRPRPPHAKSTPGAAPGWGGVLAWPLLALLWIYRRLVSPALPPACRYHPSCSQYAVEAITVHGPIRGVWLAARRLLRCHPWAPGGPDPVPPARSRPDSQRVPK